MRGPQPETLHPSYRAVAETSLQRKTTEKFAHIPGIVRVVDKILARHEKRLREAAPLEYRQTSEPVVRKKF